MTEIMDVNTRHQIKVCQHYISDVLHNICLLEVSQLLRWCQYHISVTQIGCSDISSSLKQEKVIGIGTFQLPEHFPFPFLCHGMLVYHRDERAVCLYTTPPPMFSHAPHIIIFEDFFSSFLPSVQRMPLRVRKAQRRSNANYFPLSLWWQHHTVKKKKKSEGGHINLTRGNQQVPARRGCAQLHDCSVDSTNSLLLI